MGRRNKTINRYFPVYLSEEEHRLAEQLRGGFLNDNQMFRAALRSLAGLRPEIDKAALLRQERGAYIEQLCQTLFAALHRGGAEVEREAEEARALLLQLLGSEAALAVEQAFRGWHATATLAPPEGPAEVATPQPPLVLVVEDQEAHALLVEHAFRELGCEVLVARSLVEGERMVFSHTQPGLAPRPILILLDLMFPELSPRAGAAAGRLEGSLLAARLTEAMANGQLQPAWLVAITAEPTRERAEEARLAGCVAVLSKPLRPEHVEELQRLLRRPAPRPRSDPMRRVSADAFPVLLSITDAPESRAAAAPPSPPAEQETAIWDREHAHDLLFAPANLVLEEPWAGWLGRHGGVAAVRRRLHTFKHLSESSYRLLSTILESPYVASQDFYMRALNVSAETFRRYRRKLVDEILSILKDFDRAEPEQKQGAPR